MYVHSIVRKILYYFSLFAYKLRTSPTEYAFGVVVWKPGTYVQVHPPISLVRHDMEFVDSLLSAGCSAEGTATRNPITNFADSVFDAFALHNHGQASSLEASAVNPEELAMQDNFRQLTSQLDGLSFDAKQLYTGDAAMSASPVMSSPHYQQVIQSIMFQELSVIIL